MKKKNTIDFIDKIEKIRSKNNGNWMDILRLAYKKAPKQTIKIMRNIYKSDSEISNVIEKLIKNNKN
tara:strand:- start:435 stop:635 length:201 start_codon:yes stop_codon:yes gene_type:complete